VSAEGNDKRKERERALRALEDHIGEQLRESERNGELRAAPSYGKPLGFGDGYDETPPELRMGMKILKDAGVVPPEVEAMREAAALEARLAACSDDAERRALQQQVSEKRQAIALRLEALVRRRTL
jgi:DNA-binding transcriptional ArsR family regulator